MSLKDRSIQYKTMASKSESNPILMSLDSLKYAIEFTSSKQKRHYVNRKHITNVANKLREVLKQAGIVPNNTPGANRVDDPYWYIDVLQLLAKAVRGRDGIKYLIETISIIESLLKKIETLQPETILNLQNAIKMYEKSDDNISVVSTIENKEILELFLHGNSNIIVRRARALVLLGTYLESFLRIKGYNAETLFDNCRLYGEDYTEYETFVYDIRLGRNEAAHEGWRRLSENLKQQQIKKVKYAVDNFTPFREYLLLEIAKLTE